MAALRPSFEEKDPRSSESAISSPIIHQRFSWF